MQHMRVSTGATTPWGIQCGRGCNYSHRRECWARAERHVIPEKFLQQFRGDVGCIRLFHQLVDTVHILLALRLVRVADAGEQCDVRTNIGGDRGGPPPSKAAFAVLT
eukprot:6203593-Pleurochrysis_carterae.AAC.1